MFCYMDKFGQAVLLTSLPDQQPRKKKLLQPGVKSLVYIVIDHRFKHHLCPSMLCPLVRLFVHLVSSHPGEEENKYIDKLVNMMEALIPPYIQLNILYRR